MSTTFQPYSTRRMYAQRLEAIRLRCKELAQHASTRNGSEIHKLCDEAAAIRYLLSRQVQS